MLSIKARQAHSIICMCSSTWPTAYKYYSSPHSLAYVNLWTLNEGTSSWLSNFCSRSIVLRNFVSFEVLFERYFSWGNFFAFDSMNSKRSHSWLHDCFFEASCRAKDPYKSKGDGPEIEYEAKCLENIFHLTLNGFFSFVSINVVS